MTAAEGVARSHDIWRCDHEQQELRMMRTNNGIQYRRQCLRCGNSTSSAIPHREVTVLPPDWDADLQLRFTESRRAISLQRKFDATEERKAEYALYLQTGEWKERRQRVLQRERYICQGCLSERATQVHHTTYEHLGAELLFQLIALCDACHRRIHGVDPFET